VQLFWDFQKFSEKKSFFLILSLSFSSKKDGSASKTLPPLSLFYPVLVYRHIKKQAPFRFRKSACASFYFLIA